MSFGFKVNDPYGVADIDLSSSLTRTLGSTYLNQNGSITDSRFSMGIIWWDCKAMVNVNNYFVPVFSVSGNTLSWAFPDSTKTGSCLLIYGTR